MHTSRAGLGRPSLDPSPSCCPLPCRRDCKQSDVTSNGHRGERRSRALRVMEQREWSKHDERPCTDEPRKARHHGRPPGPYSNCCRCAVSGRPNHVHGRCRRHRPPAGTPATAAADGLPTWQINGVVWSQAVVGNTVYATGSFTKARPPGVAAGGAGEVDALNIFAYDITTGNRVASFSHSLNAQGRAVTASPDGSRIYVGGDFTAVDGLPADTSPPSTRRPAPWFRRSRRT